MRLVALALAIFMTWAPAALLGAPVLRYDAQAAYDFACDVMQYDCSQTHVPLVEVVGNLYPLYGALGAYNGGDVVYLDGSIGPYLNQQYVQSVLAHEMTHYLDFKLGTINMGDATQVCVSEANGWRVGNAYLVTHNMGEFADFNWHVRYGCFQ
jgi:hypothetical protein